jgi:arginyl-tRNA synthetase
MIVADMLSRWLRETFLAELPELADALPEPLVVATADARFGDFQCNAALALAKPLKRAPRAIAEQIVAAAVPPPAIARIEIAGAGFINLHLSTAWLADYLQTQVADARYGTPRIGDGRTVVFDYSSPNVAKPMHIGHIRSTIIGNALDRLYRFLGYKVVADNHIGDWGTQFGILIMGYRHFLDRAALAQSPVEELERIYVKSYERSREDESWLRACRNELVKLQAGDADNRALWRQFVDLSMTEFARVYRRLGVAFDIARGESYYNAALPEVLTRLEAHGLTSQSEGATVVFLEAEQLPVCIVRKSDGAFNYAATDLATVADRIREFQPERIVYVTDERQQLHFKQIFTICAKLGCATRLDHVWFGLMRLPDATFSTRQGNVIKLERLLDEAEARALKIIEAGSPDMTPETRREVARAVGIGAVKYADLSQNPQTMIVFTWDKALALDGNSGPYLQYAYARIMSVRDKYATQFPGCDPAAWPIRLDTPVERALAVHLTRFPEAVMRAAHTYKPSTLADYLYELAQLYSSFYQNVPFLKAEEGVRESRMRLCGAVADVLRQGLELLGLETPERI